MILKVTIDQIFSPKLCSRCSTSREIIKDTTFGEHILEHVTLKEKIQYMLLFSSEFIRMLFPLQMTRKESEILI